MRNPMPMIAIRRPLPSPARTGGAAGRAGCSPAGGVVRSPIKRAWSRTVGAENNSVSLTAPGQRSSIIEWRRTSSRELPPASKKLASLPASSIPSTACQMARMADSTSFRGAIVGEAGCFAHGSGRALRSIFPFTSSGRSGTGTRRAGIM